MYYTTLFFCWTRRRVYFVVSIRGPARPQNAGRVFPAGVNSARRNNNSNSNNIFVVFCIPTAAEGTNVTYIIIYPTHYFLFFREGFRVPAARVLHQR